MRPVTRVRAAIPHPHRLVLVAWDELVDLAPDAAYRSAPRHDPAVDWDAVAWALSAVVARLSRTRGVGGDGLVVDLPPGLGDRERLIVDSWFTAGPAPSLDVAGGTVEGTAEWPFELWRVNHGAPLPLDLVILREAEEAPHHSDQFQRRVASEAGVALARLPLAVRARSPLAVESLLRASVLP